MIEPTTKIEHESPLSILIPQPFPDELDFGFLGRIRERNNFKDQEETIAALGKSLDRSTDPRANHVVPLARALNMPLRQFIGQHTLGFYHYAYSDETHSHAEVAARYLGNWYGRRSPTTEANFCHECVQQDVHRFGISYWRRTHQIPGLTWCVEHMSELKIASRVHPYNDVPSVLSRSTKPPPYSREVCDIVRESRVGRKYAEISLHLLKSPTSKPIDRVVMTIHSGLISLGLRVGKSRSSRYSTLADLAVDLLPRPWLIQHFSGGYSRTQNSFVGGLNKTAGNTGMSRVEHYALAQAILAEYGLVPE